MSPLNSGSYLNPDTYLNHLSLDDGIQFEISRNVFLIIFGATVWDILVYFPGDLRIIRNSRFRLVVFCFVFSRLFAAAYVLCTTIGKTMPVEKPQTLSIAGGCLCSLSVMCSSFLFLRRTHAIYSDSRLVRWFFSILWLVASGSTITIPAAVTPTFIPGTHYYYDYIIRPYLILSAACSLLFDSCVFLAISYKIASTYNPSDERIGWATLVSGRALPRLSRAVLQGGQQYYLISLVSTTLAGVVIFVPSVPRPLKSIFTAPVVPIMASMACRVFRNIKLFDLKKSSTGPVSDIAFVDAALLEPTTLRCPISSNIP